MALTPPRKTVPLASGDDSPRAPKDSTGHSFTKRVFYCGVIVEGSESGKRLPDDIQDLVLSLGNPLPTDASTMVAYSDTSGSVPDNSTRQNSRGTTDSSALSSVVNELLTSERSYVKRLQTLKNDYADPLRHFARSKDTAIIPAYEAKTLFGNIDNLLPVNEAFLIDLEKMVTPVGFRTVGGVGDVALRHFKELRGFDQYKQYYVKREDAQLIFERELSKRSNRFASYIDHIKYQSADPRNRVGLRELLMEPVQRIPRYTLLFRTMLKYMAPGDPQRAKIVEADEIASKIALAEADEQTKRAAIFYCLTATIEGFPPDLFSNSRRFIDCIDVVDTLSDPNGSTLSSSSGPSGILHCTLFLFDDKLVIVKRPGNGEKGGRILSGLEELEKVTRAGGMPTGKKKSGMTCKGVVDVTDIVATDVGSGDFHLYLENAPQDQSDRWSSRPFRAFSVVHPPHPLNMDPTWTSTNKQRFLENLWHIQAIFRSRLGQSVVLRADEQEVESKVGKLVIARTYYNVYQRTAFLQEPQKTKIVVHIDPLGSSDPIPLATGVAPFASIGIQPLAGSLCKFTVKSSIDNHAEEDIVQIERVPSRIVDTIHQYGFFEFRTGRPNSRPSTPNARSRAAIFGLDALSRNLFNTRPGQSMGELFSGTISGHKRAKSTASQSSSYTQTTTTGDGSLTRFSYRSNSTSATSIMEDDSSFFSSKSSRTKKLLKKAKSQGGLTPDSDKSPRRRLFEDHGEDSDSEDDFDTSFAKSGDLDDSERDLALQLELARRNSKNQRGKDVVTLALDKTNEATIYEEDPPQPLRSLSRTCRDSTSQRSTTPRPESTTPTKSTCLRSSSRQSQERRPLGPRSPSPLPPGKSQTQPQPSSMDDDGIENSGSTVPQPPVRLTRRGLTAIPRSKRQPFCPTGNTDVKTTTATVVSLSPMPAITEPLSIKKKTSVRSDTTNPVSPTPARRTYTRNSPLTRNIPHVTPPSSMSPQINKRKLNALSGGAQTTDVTIIEKLLPLPQDAIEDLESSRRTIKRIKLQVDDLRSVELLDREAPFSRPSSPDKEFRSPQRHSAVMSQVAQERMEEMRQLINRRQEGTPRPRLRGRTVDPPTQYPKFNDAAQNIETLVTEVDGELLKAISNQNTLQSELKNLSNIFKENMNELERTRLELQNAKRQTEVVKSLLVDATAEKDIMFEAFNEELDGMYNDLTLPDDSVWTALSNDLRQTKEARNAVTKENSQLKLRLAEAELQRDEWEALLRVNGLIP